MTLIFDEYRRFAGAKSRPLDQLKIELYDEEAVKDFAQEHAWIPSGFLLSSHGDEHNPVEPIQVVSGLAIKAQ